MGAPKKTRKLYIIGNWKMNQTVEEIKTFFHQYAEVNPAKNCETWIAPQALHLPLVKELGEKLHLKAGAQNCSHTNSGAFTGDISPLALRDLGLSFTLIGHSERRAFFKESNEIICKKTKAALDNGLKVVFCIGETLDERKANKTESVCEEQLIHGLRDIPQSQFENIIIAYEPVWAIGTGVTATPEQAQETQAFIRKYMSENMGFDGEKLSILYGGSVKPDNVYELLCQKDIDGALVGGASVKASDYTKLVAATAKL